MVFDMEFYTILGVKPGVSQDKLAAAYRKKAKTVHTERIDGGDKGKFERIQIAFFTLYITLLRQAYDEGGEDTAKKIRGASFGVFAWERDDSDENASDSDSAAEDDDSANGSEEKDEEDSDADSIEDMEADEKYAAAVEDKDGRLAAELEEKNSQEKIHFDAWVDCMGAKAIFREVNNAVKNKAIRDRKSNK